MRHHALSVLALAIVLSLPPVAEAETPGRPGETAALVPSESAPPESDPIDLSKGPEWLFLATPTGGWIHNEARIRFKVPGPKQPDGSYSYQEHTATLRDGGLGGGLTLLAVYDKLAWTNVLFWFPDVNQSSIVGVVSDLSFHLPASERLELYLGMGFVAVKTDTDYEPFKYELHQDLYGKPAIGYADFERISVDNLVAAPFPKIGVRFNIPVQHWYVTPFYSFMYEDVHTEARSPGGDVEVYYEGERALGRDPQLEVDVPDFDTVLDKVYKSHLVGANLFIDFHYFLQLRTKVYYNASHDKWTVRSIGSMLLNRHFGITAYFEYSQKTTVTNTYFLVGPAFLFSPSEFFDALDKRRKR